MNAHNLLVLSDVHLGSDLVQHARPGAPARGKAGLRRDRELVALLDWYRERPRGGRPWRLVIAGDGFQLGVMPCGDEVRTDAVGIVAQAAELDPVVAHHARIGRAAAGVFVNEIVDDAVEILLEVERVERHVEAVCHTAG